MIWDSGYHWGEWLEPDSGSMLAIGAGVLKRMVFGCPVVATAYYAHSARILAKTADLLGKEEDAKKYTALAERVKAAYAKTFIGRDGRIQPDKQASYVRVLAFDLAPEKLKPAIVNHLVRLIRAAGNHIGTGFLSTVYLCPVLAQNGRLDVAYELLTQKTKPSWLYAITRGATTVWETWDGLKEDGTPHMSLNHYSPGAVVNFLHRSVAGIEAAEAGYLRITIHPQVGGGITSASASYESAYGLIRCEWIKADGWMTVNVTIPANTRAVVRLPGASAGEVTESGMLISQLNGAASALQAGTDTQIEIGSGAYSFAYPSA